MLPILIAGVAVMAYIKRNKDYSGVNLPTIESANNQSITNVVDEVVRGLRNNNPLNIKLSSAEWKGKVDREKNTDSPLTFEQFVSPEYGIRAGYRVLQTYKAKYGIDTIRGIINRYAPATENEPKEYAEFVAKQTQLGLDQVIPDYKYAEVLAAMIRLENGYNPYSMEFINKAIAIA